MRINERAQIFFYFLSHFLLTISSIYKMTDLLERYGRLCYTEIDTRCGWTCPVMSY